MSASHMQDPSSVPAGSVRHTGQSPLLAACVKWAGRGVTACIGWQGQASSGYAVTAQSPEVIDVEVSVSEPRESRKSEKKLETA